MSAASQTKIFGMRLGVNPKIVVGGLIVLAGILFWYNSSSDDGPGAPPATSARREAVSAPEPPPAARPVNNIPRHVNQSSSNDRGVLRLRPIDGTRGDVDPTLRLDLLSRLRAVSQEPATRSLFEVGAIPQAGPNVAAIKGPTIIPKPLPAVTAPPPAPVTPAANVPLKYYGFVRPVDNSRTNEGLFLDGDNVLVLSEGQTVKQRYLVVEITPLNARVEDTQIKLGQTLPVTPVANP
jgi:hypothetical protein